MRLNAFRFALWIGLSLCPLQSFSQKVPLSELTQAESIERKQALDSVRYELHFQLDQDQTSFRVKAKIFFDLQKDVLKKAIFLELKDAKLESWNLNSKEKDPALTYDSQRIYIEPQALQKLGNVLEIDAVLESRQDGQGLHRFVDPQDQGVYFYTHFEPYYAHFVFPCFDQPDLKAKFKVEVSAPKAWEVVSNTSLAHKEALKDKDGYLLWKFRESLAMSTYLLALSAGPFHIWESEGPAGLPLRLFSRASLKSFVEPDAATWFQVAKKGLEFYKNYFNLSYPFQKLDLLIVPQFNMGAMENIGAVTFTERLVFFGPATRERQLARADTILHEIAHMWFGNLMTMSWWDDLWLNESFATLMSSLALPYAYSSSSESSLVFFSWMKSWAYETDCTMTRHPIRSEVKDTQGALARFDGITYGKGAASLKQLRFQIGENAFQHAIASLLKERSFANANFGDFLQALSKRSSKPLQVWAKEWLSESGSNTLELDWACKNERISRMNLIQNGSTGTPFREHRVRVSRFQGAHFTPVESFAVTYSGSKTALDTWLGKPCPKWVFANLSDEDVVLPRLDKKSLEFWKKQGFKLKKAPSDKEALAELVFWQALSFQVRDGTLPAQLYAQWILDALSSHSRHPILLSKMLSFLSQGQPSKFSARRLLDQKNKKEVLLRLEKLASKQLEFQEKGLPEKKLNKLQLDQKRIWLQSWLEALEPNLLAQDDQLLQKLKSLLSGKLKIPGISLEMSAEPERRWSLIKTLIRLTGDDKIVKQELESSKALSSQAKEWAITAQAFIPSQKEFWMDELRALKRPLVELKAAILGLRAYGQEELWDQLEVQALSWLEFSISKGSSATAVAELVAEHLIGPGFCTFLSKTDQTDPNQKSFNDQTRLRAFLAKKLPLPVGVLESLNIALEAKEQECQILKSEK